MMKSITCVQCTEILKQSVNYYKKGFSFTERRNDFIQGSSFILIGKLQKS